MKKMPVYIFITVFSALFLSHQLTFSEDGSGSVSTEPVTGTSGEIYASEETPMVDNENAGLEETAAVAAAAAVEEPVQAGRIGKGIGLSPLLGESFQTDLATGSATVSIPLVVPPGRKNMQPGLALSYSSNSANGICGVGWGLTGSSVQRSTKNGPPEYNNEDTFIFGSSGSSGELVLINALNREYRQKIETGFMRYIYDEPGQKWDVWDKNGTKYSFGNSVNARIVNPEAANEVFAWFLDKVEDVYGNAVVFTYEEDGAQLYLSIIEYTVNDKVDPALPADKTVEFIYDNDRPDKFNSFRSGWEIQTNKRLKEVHIKVDNALVWRYVLEYEESVDTDRSLFAQVTLIDSEGNSLPSKRFTYQTVE